MSWLLIFFDRLGCLSLTRINFNPAWMNNYIYRPTLNWVCGYLAMLGLKLIHTCKRGPGIILWCWWLTGIWARTCLWCKANIKFEWVYTVATQETIQGLYSLSGKTSYRQISWNIEAVRLCVIIVVSRWNLTAISLLPRCLSNFRAIG